MTRVTWDFAFELDAPMGAANKTLRDALTGIGFQLTGQSLTAIEGRRGSKKFAMLGGGALLATKKLPMRIGLLLSSSGSRCHVAVRLGDDYPAAQGLNARTTVIQDAYRKLFREVAHATESALGMLSPALEISEPEERVE